MRTWRAEATELPELTYGDLMSERPATVRGNGAILSNQRIQRSLGDQKPIVGEAILNPSLLRFSTNLSRTIAGLLVFLESPRFLILKKRTTAEYQGLPHENPFITSCHPLLCVFLHRSGMISERDGITSYAPVLK